MVRRTTIRAVTLWVCSIDNLRRSPDEVSGILVAVETKWANGRGYCDRSPWRSCESRGAARPSAGFDGRRARGAEAATAAHTGLKLTIAIAYGGREEIADAVRDLIARVSGDGASLEAIAAEITPEAEIDGHLYTAGLPNLDLIIRTSGEIRLSGFCCGKARTASSTFPMSIGRSSARSTFSAPSARFSSGNDGSGAERQAACAPAPAATVSVRLRLPAGYKS